MLSLILAALLTSPGVGSPTAKLSPGNLGEELYYASAAASGSRLCDGKRAARLGKKFDQHFGDRIRALRETHEALYGPDPDFIYTTSCNRPGPNYSQRQAFKDFEPKLRDLERKYGQH